MRPSATAIAFERELVALVGDETRVLSSAAPPMQPRLMELCEMLRQERSGVVCVDLQRRKESHAVLCLHRVGGGPFTTSEDADAERFALFAALAINEMAERERAERDEVTGMPGRTLLLRSLEEWYAGGRPFALACVDFDGLKAVNETKGYEKGNLLICAVAKAIEKLLRDGEIVGRLHGRSTSAASCWKRHSIEPTFQRSSRRHTSASQSELRSRTRQRRSAISSLPQKAGCDSASKSAGVRKGAETTTIA